MADEIPVVLAPTEELTAQVPHERHEDVSAPSEFQLAAAKLADDLIAEAQRAEQQAEAGALWCCAGELHEFGTGNRREAFRCYGKAATHPSAPTSSFAGLRRLARLAGRKEQLGDLYRIECEAAEAPDQRVRALVQQAIWLMRRRALDELPPLDAALRESENSDPWVTLLAYTARQDIALARKAYGEAAEVQVARLALAESNVPEPQEADRRELAEIAAGIAMTHRYLTGDREAAAKWFDRSFRWLPSESALHALGTVGWMDKLPAEFERRIVTLLDTAPEPFVAARQHVDLAMLRSHKLANREAAGAALQDGMRVAESGVVAAFEYVGAARSQASLRTPDAMVDALGIRAEHAATPLERADCLYQMARIFDADMGLPDAAIELLRESLTVCPAFQPAAKSLSRMYQRRGSWDLLAELLEAELASDRDAWRTRMSLAEVYQRRLLVPERAEPHLRAVLAQRYYQPAAHRLAELLSKQERWAELHELRLVAAEAETDVRERLFHLERAAELAEYRLHKPEVAVECWRAVHEIDPLNPAGLSALGRLLRQLGRWEDLVALNADEISVRDETEAVARLWTDNGHIHIQHLNDDGRAQECFEFALEVLPTYEPALEGLGRILWASGDWDALVEMHTAEINALPTGQRRTRRMLDLGELQANRVGRPTDALATFQSVFRDDPACEEALLWMERLHQVGCQDAKVLAVLERRLKLTKDDPNPLLSLRAALLAEWALGQPERAWPHYLSALGERATRPHALQGMGRLWNHMVEDEDVVNAALAVIDEALEDEERAPLVADLKALQAVLSRGSRTLTTWADMLIEVPEDVVARGAVEVSAAVNGDIDRLSELRAERRTGALWCLAAAPDSESPALPDEAVTPETGIVLDLFAEMDRVAAFGDPEATLRALEFRHLVRAWASGDEVPQPSGDHPSISALRLSSHAALEAGDPVSASAFTELEARAWSDAPTMQRRLVVAAELRHSSHQEAAQALFRSALDLGCYTSPSRVELYDALERRDELEILCEGLTAHVAHCDQPEARLPWLRRLASTAEQADDRNGALAAWQAILAIHPADAVALLEQTRLLTLEGMLDEARIGLERALRREFPKADRLGLLSKLADLQLMEDGDGTKAVTALEEAAELAGRTNAWLRRLARAHYTYGKADRAVGLLVEALPSSMEEPDLPDWFLLARLKYLKLDDPDGARELLWGLMERFPGNLDVLEQIEVFYRKKGSARELAERLSNMLLNPPDELPNAAKSFLWEYVGDLNYQVLRRNRDAEVAFESALAAGGPAGALTLKTARAIAQQPGKGREAILRFATVLGHPKVGLSEWREVVSDLEALFEGIEDQARLRVIRQVDRLLTNGQDEADNSRVKRDPGREIPMESAVEKLSAGCLETGSLAVIRALLPLLERVFSARRPRKRAVGGRRLKAAEATEFFRLVSLGAETLDATTPKVFVSPDARHPEWIAGGFLLPASLIELSDDLTTRFWAGHTIGSCAPGFSALALAQPGEIESIMSEIIRLEAGGAPSDDGLFKEIAASRHASLREEVAELIQQHPDLVERVAAEDWLRLPIVMADRLGLLMTGDACVAVRTILELDAEVRAGEAPARAVDEGRPRALLAYALSTEYHDLRYHAGLGARPRIL